MRSSATDCRPRLIGFTGGEPFMNPDIIAMLDDVLSRGFDALVLTNAMKPMRKLRPQLLALREAYGDRLRIRVSLDHYTPAVHEAERGRRSWAPTIDGLVWLARNGFAIDVAGRRFSGEPEADLRAGFARLFAELDVPVDAADPVRLMLFPEMDAQRDVPEITTACWGILHKSPDDVMCASARMVVKRKDAAAPAVLACTLLAIRSAVRTGRHAGGGGAAGVTEPSLLRVVLRARRGGVQPLANAVMLAVSRLGGISAGSALNCWHVNSRKSLTGHESV